MLYFEQHQSNCIMLRILIACLFLLPLTVFSQKKDGFFVADKDGKWYISHKVSRGETLFVVARRYHVPPAMLADANDMDYQDAFTKTTANVPLGAYNYRSKETGSNDVRKLYYKVKDEESLGSISRMAGVSQRVIQGLNNMEDNDVDPGQVLMVGWVLYDATQMPEYTTINKPVDRTAIAPQAPLQQLTTKPAGVPVAGNTRMEKLPDGTTVTYLKLQDTTNKDTLGVLGGIYMAQTNNEENTVEEKGTVTFYDDSDGVKGKTLFAFHSTVSRGTVIKIYNPGSGKTIFAKVIGPLPGTKQYHGSILGLPAQARDDLGVANEKAWCELTYAPR